MNAGQVCHVHRSESGYRSGPCKDLSSTYIQMIVSSHYKYMYLSFQGRDQINADHRLKLLLDVRYYFYIAFLSFIKLWIQGPNFEPR